MKESLYDLILVELKSSYTREEMEGFKKFKDFWDEEDVRQAYEENWEEEKPNLIEHYIKIYNDFKDGNIKWGEK